MRKKFPRTYHMPFSPGTTSDDKIHRSLDHFVGKDTVWSIKKDGENTSLYRVGFHARSLDSRHNASRDWVARFHASIAHEIPDGWRICGENLYAKHSIHYTDLPSYFMGFSVWDDKNQCLGWDETLEYFDLLGITPVEEIYRGPYDEKKLLQTINTFDTEKEEGLVMRLSEGFGYDDYARAVAKWVRKGHVQTDEHWMHSEIVPNLLREKSRLKP